MESLYLKIVNHRDNADVFFVLVTRMNAPKIASTREFRPSQTSRCISGKPRGQIFTYWRPLPLSLFASTSSSLTPLHTLAPLVVTFAHAFALLIPPSVCPFAALWNLHSSSVSVSLYIYTPIFIYVSFSFMSTVSEIKVSVRSGRSPARVLTRASSRWKVIRHIKYPPHSLPFLFISSKPTLLYKSFSGSRAARPFLSTVDIALSSCSGAFFYIPIIVIAHCYRLLLMLRWAVFYFFRKTRSKLPDASPSICIFFYGS